MPSPKGTKDGGRTHVISSRWRHIWRSAPLNIDLLHCRLRQRHRFDAISGVLSSHRGPAAGSRFLSTAASPPTWKAGSSSLHTLLAVCPDLQSLLLDSNHGCAQVEIRLGHGHLGGVCTKIGFFGAALRGLPQNSDWEHRFEGSHIVSLMMVVRSVKVLALAHTNISLDVVIDFMKCFPCVEKLYIKVGEKSSGCHKYQNLISTLDIHVKKIVLTNYLGNGTNANFAKFFVLHARLLESMTLELQQAGNISSAWIGRQNRLLLIKKRASKNACFDFVARNIDTGPTFVVRAKQVHDLSADPFVNLGIISSSPAYDMF
ncbi:hypothetical protein EJB05_13889, partial [Eragrostis curvula]